MDNINNIELKIDMNKALSMLSERERLIVELRAAKYTLQDIGESQGVTRERIRDIEQRAYRKLRHPARARYIKDYNASR